MFLMSSYFVARQHAMHTNCRERYCYGKSVRLSVRLSVQCRYCVYTNGRVAKIFDDLIGTSLSPIADTKFSAQLTQRGALNTRGWENFAKITFDPGNGTRYTHMVSTIWIANRWPIDSCRI